MISQINKKVRDSILLGSQNVEHTLETDENEFLYNTTNAYSNRKFLNFKLKQYQLELTRSRKSKLEQEVNKIENILIDKKANANTFIPKRIFNPVTSLEAKSLRGGNEILRQEKELMAKQFVEKINSRKVVVHYHNILPPMKNEQYFSVESPRKYRNVNYVSINRLPSLQSRNYQLGNSAKKNSKTIGNNPQQASKIQLDKIKQKYKDVASENTYRMSLEQDEPSF